MPALLRWGWLAPIAAIAALSLWARPLLPADETRYATVAWEMWRDGQWLVPQLNGAPYSHKPPLLFWLIHAGWWLFGVNEWWPRLLGAIAAIASGALTRALGVRLFPMQPRIADLAPWILVGSLYWLGDSTMLMFDHLLTGFVLLGWLGVLRWRDGAHGGLALAALAVGLGMLAKGPLAPLFVVPAFAFARPAGLAWSTALLRAGAAMLAGLALAAAWLLPAIRAGGRAYGAALLHDQSVGRIAGAFAHALPTWWYLPMLPLLWLPWSVMPAFWRSIGAGALNGWRGDAAMRFCVGTAAVALAALSLISGKQPHYLLPLFPLMALLLAHALHLARAQHTIAIAAVSALGLALLLAGVAPYALQRFDLRALSRDIGTQQRSRDIAFADVYRGQFSFLGRLQKPLPTVPRHQVRAWLRRHPQGLVVGEIAVLDSADARAAAWTHPYRSRHFAGWTAASLAAVPDALPETVAAAAPRDD